MVPLIAFFVLIGLIATGLFVMTSARGAGSSDRQAINTQTVLQRPTAKLIEAGADDELLRIPAEQLAPAKANFFTCTTTQGREIRFFVVDLADGQYRAALDMCRGCYRMGLGYAQEKDELICRKCGHRVPLAMDGPQLDECHPVPLAVESNHEVSLHLQSVIDLAAQYAASSIQQ